MFLVPFVMDIIPVFVSVRRVAVNLQATVSTPVGSHVLAIILLFQPPVTSGHTPTTTTGFYCVNGDIPVLLQTAQAYIHRPTDPACGMNIRLMFDGGSQRSYITERVKEVLGLDTECSEVVNIKTFGSETTKTQTVDVVTASIHLKEGTEISISFSTVPLICEPLSCQPVAYSKRQYRHLSGLDLADYSRVGEELQIDALIGLDHYWRLVTGRVVHGESGPTAIYTQLGLYLSISVYLRMFIYLFYNPLSQLILNDCIVLSLHIWVVI